MANEEFNWMDSLDLDATPGVMSDQQREQFNKAIEFARHYQVFETDERAKALYAHWKETILERITPTESSLQRYAADNAMREFVLNIGRQLSLGKEQPR
jgi:hypothetical protein